MNKDSKKNKYLYYFILFVTGICFFFLLGQNDYVLYKDSVTYLEPTEFVSERYILYPLFLNTCRSVFGSDIFLSVVYWIQGSLALIVSWVSVEYFRKRYKLSYVWSVLIYLCLFLPYGYSLPENVVTHHILTEGLAYTFFHFFLLQSIKSYLESSWKNMIGAFVTLLLLVLLRNQLLFLLPVFLILIIGFILKKRELLFDFKNNIIKIVVAIGSLFVFLNIAFVCLISSGKFLQATTAVSGRVLCLIDGDDEKIFTGAESEIYLELYDAVMTNGTNADSFRTGLKGWEDIANASNENTKIWRKIVTEYYLENMSDRIDDGIDRIIASMSGKLLQEHYFEYWTMTITLCLESLVLSIFIQPSRIFNLCNMVAALLYILSICMFVRTKRSTEDDSICIPYIITMITLLTNALITNMLFYGIQRYIVYTFGYFYLSLLLIISKKRLKVKEA